MIHQRGQSTVEYAVLLAVIIAALLAVQIYVKRGAMGRLRSSTDSIGEQFNPHLTKSHFGHTYETARTDELTNKGQSTATLTGAPRTKFGEAQDRTGWEKMEPATGTAQLKDEQLFFQEEKK